MGMQRAVKSTKQRYGRHGNGDYVVSRFREGLLEEVTLNRDPCSKKDADPSGPMGSTFEVEQAGGRK